MAELEDRDGIEAQIARALAELLGKHAAELLALLGAGVVAANLTEEVFTKQAAEYAAILAPALGALAQSSSEELLALLPVDVDDADLSGALAAWTSEYTGELVRGITATNRGKLAQLISQYFERSETIGELERKIARLFGPRRAETIAVTEVTAASANGELLVGQLLKAQDVDLVPTWHTNRDDHVCPICRPFDQVQQSSGVFTSRDGLQLNSPPAHPRCRCFLSHSILRNGRKVLTV